MGLANLADVPRCALSSVLILALVATSQGIALAKQSRDDKVRSDKAVVEAEGFWIYNDLDKAFLEAVSTNKPLLVVFRCIPCVECVKLDEDILNDDAELHQLLERFVRVRIVSTNGLDLSMFQFDFDQSFAVFLLNADGTIYGRYGTRSHRTEWADDVSVAGLKNALHGALELHRNYPSNATNLRDKRGTQLPSPVPEKFPSLSKYPPNLDYNGNVVSSCIHCHMVGDAIKEFERSSDRGISAQALFPYPHPKSLGLILDPNERATVLKVAPDSPAAESGFQPGDVITALSNQPLLSIADVQWVLHQLGEDETTIQADIIRGNKVMEINFRLPKGWRELDDISWRASSWELRRWALGGMQLRPANPRPVDIPANQMALNVQHVGQYSPHDAAKNAGFAPGDTIVSFDGKSDLLRETDVLAYAIRGKTSHRNIPIGLLRDGKRLEIVLPGHD